MKRGVLLYETVYGILKNRIESGLIGTGEPLLSRAEVCEEFGVSGKTARRAVGLLKESGLIETNRRKRATVGAEDPARRNNSVPLKKAIADYADETIKTGVLLCYPLVASGIARLNAEDWIIPEKIYASMRADRPEGFWKRSNRIWRFFIARNENDMSLRAVDSLGLSEIDPLPGTLETRKRYLRSLGEYLYKVKRGESGEDVTFEDLSYLYGFAQGRKDPAFLVTPESPMVSGGKAIERCFSGAEMRYSAVYMDILGMIAAKRYLPGDKLPTHRELCESYGVSADTTVKAIGILKEWGVVAPKRGSGIFVAADLAGLKRIEIAPELIAVHVRRYLDSLELLSATVEGVAAHAAARADADEARQLNEEIDRLFRNDYLYLRSPSALLRFIAERIEYEPLRAIYRVLLKNYHIGRSVPKLVTRDKNEKIIEINDRCAEAAQTLSRGDTAGFSEEAAEIFRYIHRLVVAECSKFGYLEPASRVYDGSSLWK